MSVQARSGFEYFVTFTDDFSKYGYIYLLRRKSKCFEKVKEFKAKTEKRHGKYIKSLRSDRGGEYLSREFITYLSEQGITSQLSAPGMPGLCTNRNGVVERTKLGRLVGNGTVDWAKPRSKDIVSDVGFVPALCAERRKADKVWNQKTDFIALYWDILEDERSIYGLKQASRSWNTCFDQAIKSFGFDQCHDESCMLNSVKDWLSQRFDMKDLGEAAHILRIKLMRDRKKRMIGLSQALFIDTILARFSMQDSKKGFLPFRHGITLSKDQFFPFQTWNHSTKDQCPKGPPEEDREHGEGIP
ncbi:uncharacterized protein LOC119369277 [Jatropha curcas]|uniref:uncharacterized protein LOC119369277 n=1 Tax=Jatropha curcas TaxID=180498 RepID=UPI001894D8F2|nr:uncharacterized protein LOC119369277 [Jatropha curcas]